MYKLFLFPHIAWTDFTSVYVTAVILSYGVILTSQGCSLGTVDYSCGYILRVYTITMVIILSCITMVCLLSAVVCHDFLVLLGITISTK